MKKGVTLPQAKELPETKRERPGINLSLVPQREQGSAHTLIWDSWSQRTVRQYISV